MKASDLFVKCLENEGVEYIFGIPGEENLDVMDSLIGSDIEFITTRHEQGAAFMADVYGRLTGKAGVCLATLGPGATNLVTGFADANMDRAPIIGIAGQGATTRMHKESHQVLDLVNLFEPISKYSVQIREPEIVPEIIRKAFKAAQAEKPGGSFIDVPENVAAMKLSVDKEPLKVQSAQTPVPPQEKILQAAEIINNARYPIVMAGNGVIRSGASDCLVEIAEKLNLPVATTFMAKGVIPFSHALSLGTVGLQAKDYVACGFDRADVIICVGYDMVEYHPHLWHKNKDKKIIHIDMNPAEVDEHYIVECGVIGEIGAALKGIGGETRRVNKNTHGDLRQTIVDELAAHKDDDSYPLKPQRIIWDIHQALNDEDIVVSDVGAHKMWMARMYQAERPNTCIISNGFASMGIGVPGAIAAKLAKPGVTALTVTGDAGFMMNSQEIETALRYQIPIIILIWTDSEYGLIKWHQLRRFGRDTNISFSNPDFVKYAESFGAKGYRIEKAEDLILTIKKAKDDNTVVIIDCPVDYSENMKLTEKLGNLVCPI
ncbi:MAG: acetolactate synthase large subunit [Gammaproteobacteria bacterium]|nr:acetolactate synthase large subunit [Gammaproteobacteria bacterium]MBT6550654.1 acetolactate synthase large subunit [Gammaproteobacteria bacterium]